MNASSETARMREGNQRDWREICMEVLAERNTERVNVLLEELLDALDRRPEARSPQVPNPDQC
jgi:hypothetical protein